MSGPRTPVVQVLATLGTFVVLGLVGAVLWWQVVDLPTYTRVADNGRMDAVQMSGSVAIDGWYAVIGGLAAALAAAALGFWATLSPRLNVLAIAGGSVIGGWLMLVVGKALGPGEVSAALARAAVGDRVPVQLVPNSAAMSLLWPTCALAVAALVLIFGPAPKSGANTGYAPPLQSMFSRETP